jgi:hypothetical protein
VVRTIDDPVIDIAVLLKTYHTPIALGDSIAVALAATRHDALLTTDRGELAKIAAAGICQIEFLR